MILKASSDVVQAILVIDVTNILILPSVPVTMCAILQMYHALVCRQLF